MTSLAADHVGLRDRGRLVPGAYRRPRAVRPGDGRRPRDHQRAARTVDRHRARLGERPAWSSPMARRRGRGPGRVLRRAPAARKARRPLNGRRTPADRRPARHDRRQDGARPDPRPLALPTARRGRRRVRRPRRRRGARRPASRTCPASRVSTRRSRAAGAPGLAGRRRRGARRPDAGGAARPGARRGAARHRRRQRPAPAARRRSRDRRRRGRRAPGSTTSGGRRGSPSCAPGPARRCASTVPRVAVLGTDCALGKRTTATFLLQGLRRRGLAAELVTTGQTGWLQGHRYGFILDATPNDFVSGELERAVVGCAHRGAPGPDPDRGPVGAAQSERPVRRRADAFGRGGGVVLQHAPGRVFFDGCEAFAARIPPVENEVELLERLRRAGPGPGAQRRGARRSGAARRGRAARDAALGLPVAMPLLDRGEPLLDAVERIRAGRRGHEDRPGRGLARAPAAHPAVHDLAPDDRRRRALLRPDPRRGRERRRQRLSRRRGDRRVAGALRARRSTPRRGSSPAPDPRALGTLARRLERELPAAPAARAACDMALWDLAGPRAGHAGRGAPRPLPPRAPDLGDGRDPAGGGGGGGGARLRGAGLPRPQGEARARGRGGRRAAAPDPRRRRARGRAAHRPERRLRPRGPARATWRRPAIWRSSSASSRCRAAARRSCAPSPPPSAPAWRRTRASSTSPTPAAWRRAGPTASSISSS